MKVFKTNNIVIALIFFCAASLITNCASLNETSREGNVGTAVQMDEAKNFDESKDLTQHLSEISGLRVLGTGADARIRIRGGQNSFQLSSEPLYVVNNSPISGGYGVLYGLIDVGSIVKIKVLKGADASMYGSRGSNGVIEIFTR
ncbi:MAG: TonB-dependent receptor plug domain-containing protein [Balneolaceae bacterium]|nr:TonB-dependent receptor plug domain-containing protein [Balneolaceae bacterium]MBO6545360.1 TonB-dependent receptor plug domain-containing protein [Balneolaceae bacterium]MBO6646756.1 TonB-dependent receptor plug domain-containing protein [Balneolaceae bacterium]